MSIEQGQRLENDVPVDYAAATATEPPAGEEPTADEDTHLRATPESHDTPIAESGSESAWQPDVETREADAQPVPVSESAHEPVAETGQEHEPEAAEPEVAEPEVRTPKSQVDDTGTPLLEQDDIDGLRTRWQTLQGAFIDSPRDAVTQAEELVGETIQQLATTFAERAQALERDRSSGTDADTERLRQALRGYRATFNQLLTN